MTSIVSDLSEKCSRETVGVVEEFAGLHQNRCSASLTSALTVIVRAAKFESLKAFRVSVVAYKNALGALSIKFHALLFGYMDESCAAINSEMEQVWWSIM